MERRVNREQEMEHEEDKSETGHECHDAIVRQEMEIRIQRYRTHLEKRE